MNVGWLLLGLLAIAFLGSNVARGRGVRGFGLPSGSEWILTGTVLGPQLFGVVRLQDLSTLAPVLAAGLGWVAMIIGMRFAICLRPNLQEEVAAPRKTLALGALLGLVTAAAVTVVVNDLLGRWGSFSPRVRLGTACWIGCALSGSARQLVDWAKERHGAKGSTTVGIEATFGGGEIVALTGTAPLSVMVFSEATAPTDLVWRASLPLVLGLSLGLITLWLLHFEVRISETWGILLGVQLLSVGLSLRAGSSVLAAGFVLGWLLGRDRQAGPELRRMTHPAEGTVLLPLLVVAGASLPATSLGLALASSGEVACLVALEYMLSTPGQLGQLVLTCAIVASLCGEFYGAVGLRQTLRSVNELGADEASAGPRRRSVPPGNTGWT